MQPRLGDLEKQVSLGDVYDWLNEWVRHTGNDVMIAITSVDETKDLEQVDDDLRTALNDLPESFIRDML